MLTLAIHLLYNAIDGVLYQCHSILRCQIIIVKSSLEYYGYSCEAITLRLCDDGALRNYGGRQMRGFVKHLHVYIENLKTEEYCYAKNKIKILKYFLEQVIYLDKSAIRFIIYSFVYKTYLYYDLTSANGNIF
jgi:hypothetical protein